MTLHVPSLMAAPPTLVRRVGHATSKWKCMMDSIFGAVWSHLAWLAGLFLSILDLRHPARTAAALLFGLIAGPIFKFLYTGWEIRRTDIAVGWTDEAIKAYFQLFRPSAVMDSAIKDSFRDYYNSQFGRKRFTFPTALFLVSTLVVLLWSASTIEDLLASKSASTRSLPVLAIVAFSGAYMWIVADEIAATYHSNMTPADGYWWSFRLAVAVPMAYAIQSAFTPALALPVAFFLGAFPTNKLIAICRRVAAQKLNLPDSEDGAISELQSLDGIDIRVAETLRDEELTTVLQLAYTDPVRLAIRTGLPYSFIVDCMGQALLSLYVGKARTTMSLFGLRSAYEVHNLCEDLDSQDAKEKDDAARLLDELAKELKTPTVGILNMLYEVARDPYTTFIVASWMPENKVPSDAAKRPERPPAKQEGAGLSERPVTHPAADDPALHRPAESDAGTRGSSALADPGAGGKPK